MVNEEALQLLEDLPAALLAVPSRVVSSPLLTVPKQVRFPKSKSKRIRKKWAKRSENFIPIADKTVYKIGGQYTMHPSVMLALKKQLGEQHRYYFPSTMIA